MESLSFDQYRELAALGLAVPCYKIIPADLFTPITIYNALRKKGTRSFILDSCDHSIEEGRYSFLGFNPIYHFEGSDLELLRKKLKEYQTADLENMPPFSGGAVGFFSYDAIRIFEKIPDSHPNDLGIPQVLFNFYETTLAFDHFKQKLIIFDTIKPSHDLRASYDNSIKKIDEIIRKIESYSVEIQPKKAIRHEAIQVDVSDEAFKEMIARAKAYIHNGDIFQVVLSRTFSKRSDVDPFDIFRALRMVSPTHYLFYLEEPDYQIFGASPERLIELNKGFLKTNPLAGTKPRPSIKDQERVEKELLSNPKEVAEHMMLVDLGRNDIGSIAEIGSVKVVNLKTIMRLSHVIHISSEVIGKIKAPFDAIDAIRATLPAGTLSGAPKI
ncbi:MAG: anthranilate synthase component I family protein, partial [Parachlamydiaceae bacterium]